jgi:hypothetical protein
MKKLLGVALLVALFSFGAFAQEGSKAQVFGGYQFTSMDGGWHGNGWNGAADVFANKWLGITGDFSGTYSQGLSFMTYSAGPVVAARTGSFRPFAHGLFGGGHASANGVGDSGFVMMFGGGVDLGHQKLALRLAQFDWMTVRFNGISDKNNMRISTGVLYRF